MTVVSTCSTTLPGPLYHVSRHDTCHNRVEDKVIKRPQVVAYYSQYAGAVDQHNQIRQGYLALEKAWVTTDCWFRLHTTLFGITVTDAFLAYRHLGRGPSTSVDLQSSMHTFATELAVSFVKWGFELDARPLPPMSLPIQEFATEGSAVTGSHQKATYPRKTKEKTDGSTTTVAVQKNCQWCFRVLNVVRKTTCYCVACNVPLCKIAHGGSDVSCFELHVLNPLPKKQKRSKRTK